LTNEFKKQDLEILVSTMNRNSLDFLIPMFPFCHFSEFSILIINQTEEDDLLVSEFPFVRVINSFEKGLSRSRNLALKNAIGKIILISDDDEVFKDDFDTIIINTYNNFPKAVVISFQVENSEGRLFRKYSKKTKIKLDVLDLFGIFSPEISINKTIFDVLSVEFDTDFGLGSTFPMAEEAIFLMDLKSRKQQIVFEPKVLATNPTITTTDKLDFMQRYYIQGAFLSRVLKANYFTGLAAKLFFDLKQKKLKFNQILVAIKNANQGKTDYYKLKNKSNA
jgi:glycosyltransferase involved in cell wall biosynthesis